MQAVLHQDTLQLTMLPPVSVSESQLFLLAMTQTEANVNRKA